MVRINLATRPPPRPQPALPLPFRLNVALVLGEGVEDPQDRNQPLRGLQHRVLPPPVAGMGAAQPGLTSPRPAQRPVGFTIYFCLLLL